MAELARVLLAGLAAYAAARLFTPLTVRYATRRGWLHHPRADRWSQRTVALMGGIAICGATLVGLLGLGGAFDFRIGALILASLFMFVVGAVDDRVSLAPHIKLLTQVLAAVLLVHAGFRIGLPEPWPAAIDPLLTIFWLVGIGNAFNLLDNMDGLCAGIAGIAAGFLALLQLAAGNLGPAVAAAALAGACLGFLRFNQHPATIFMGDCGSLFIGFFLAGAVLLKPGDGVGRGLLSVLALPVLLMLIPLTDTMFVTVMRKLHCRPVSQGGRDHTSHRLVAIGLSEPRAVRLLYLLAVCGGLAAVAVQQLDWYLSTLGVAAVLFVAGVLAWTLGGVRVYPDGDKLTDLLAQTPLPILAQHRYRRRLGEVLVDTVGISTAYYVASALRYEGALAAPHQLQLFRETLPIVLGCHLLAYALAGVYRGIWRYTSVSDLPKFVRASSLGLLLTVIALAATGHLAGMSRSVLAINLLVQLTLLAGTRVSLKLLKDRLVAMREPRGGRVLAVGTGPGAALELRRLREQEREPVSIVGLIGERDTIVGLTLMGIPVLGTPATAAEVIAKHPVDEVMLLDESFPASLAKQVYEAAAAAGVAIRMVKRTVESAPAYADVSAAG